VMAEVRPNVVLSQRSIKSNKFAYVLQCYLIIPVTFYRVKYLGASARDRTTELGPMG
jgi:hypothetical protein